MTRGAGAVLTLGMGGMIIPVVIITAIFYLPFGLPVQMLLEWVGIPEFFAVWIAFFFAGFVWYKLVKKAVLWYSAKQTSNTVTAMGDK